MVEETDKNFKAKSASISRRTTAATVRSLTSTSLKRNKKNAEQKTSEPKIENTSQMKEKDLKINTSEINSGKSSNRSQSNKVEEKQRDGNDVKSANSKILKPITLKLDKDHGSAFNEKDNIPNKTVKQSRENFQELKEEKTVVARYDRKMNKSGSLRSRENIPSKTPRVATNPKVKTSDSNVEMKIVDDTSRAKSDDGNRKMSAKDDCGIDAKRLSNRSLTNVNDIQECKTLSIYRWQSGEKISLLIIPSCLFSTKDERIVARMHSKQPTSKSCSLLT
jgi:hypothetical protein